MKILLLAGAVVCPALWLQTAMAEPVKVEGGLVRGIVEDNLTVYRGIPFAAPPVGDLRWRAPRPAQKWEGVRKADRFAPGCMQSMGGPSPSGASEDCLYLNVWTPAKSPKDRVPVLVWIYGGGFNGGATSIPVCSGEKLARRGVVLVSIAYRVGIMGFYAHPELSAESPRHVSGNYGLLDMIAGLQWIRHNIAAFGGDPKRVTIFGESAGGIAVSMLCASPLAKGLFTGAISQSGGSFGPSSRIPVPGENMRVLAEAEVSGAEFAKTAGAASLRELRALPADKLLDVGRRQRGMAWPIVDGWVIPDDQYRLYEAGRFNDTAILLGYNSDEGLSFSPPHTPDDYIAGVRKRYGPFADRLLQAYPTATDTVPKTARDLARDSAFGWHTWVWSRLQSQHGKGKAYYYYFDQHQEHPAGSPQAGQGSPHGADVAYVFEHLDDIHRPATPEDRQISEAMATYWTNFAKRGDPNGKGGPFWPAFSDASPVVMYFAGTPHTGPVPSEESLRVLDSYFAWRRTPQGAAVRPAGNQVPNVAAEKIHLSVDASKPGAKIDRNIFGQFAEHLGHGIYEGVWVGPDSTIPNTRGIRNDVVAALRALKVPNVRWPGGCFADEYHWRKGLGPLDKRVVSLNPNWGGVTEPNTFGTHEFMDFVDQIGSEAYVSVNVGSGTPQEAAEWLEYLTTDQPTTLAKERAANGHPAPYKIGYLGIGNESWDCGGNMTVDYYLSQLKIYSRFVRNYNPAQDGGRQMLKIAVGPGDPNTEWTEAIMKAYRNRHWSWDINGLSMHSYTVVKWPPSYASVGFGAAEYSRILSSTLEMEGLVTKQSAVMDKYDPEKKVALVVDEWGAWYAPLPGSNPGFLVQQNSLRDAILASLNLNIFARHADRVRMANIAQMINVLQAMIITDKEKMVLTPTYHAFKMYLPFQDATIVPVTFDVGTYTNGDISLPRLDAIAAKDASGKLWLAITNIDPEKPVETEAELAGIQVKSATGETLTAPKVDSVNSFEAPNAVVPKPISAKVQDGKLALHLEPKSVTVIALER